MWHQNNPLISEKEWTWQEIAEKVKFSDRPINHSLLKLETNELDKLACESFLCKYPHSYNNFISSFSGIMKYMEDEPRKRAESVTDVVYGLLLMCYKHSQLKDEVYCQIIKQTTNNRSAR